MKTIQVDQSVENHRIRKLRGGVLDADAVNLKQSEHSKSISVLAPQNSDDIVLFYTRYAITVQDVWAVLRGSSTPTVLFNIRYDSDRNALGTKVVNSQTASSVTTGDNIAIDNSAIPVNSWVWLEVTTVGGTVDEFHLTLFYRTDP